MPTLFTVNWKITGSASVTAEDEDEARMLVEGMTIAAVLESAGMDLSDQFVEIDLQGPPA